MNSDNKKFMALSDKRDYDILNMLNSISNFEIFTPFNITKSMIDMLPQEVFQHPEYKFLDPAVKSGIFLREIIYKLDENLPRITYVDIATGITYNLSDKKERVNHILKNMVYGIAISELTSYVARRTIYGVMDAVVDKSHEYIDSKILSNKKDTDKSEDLYLNRYYDHSMFNTFERMGYENEGNIFYPNKEETIDNEDTFYPFINNTNHKFINKIKDNEMKFDVIIGNPPYQSSDGGGKGTSAKPLYNIYIKNSMQLKPKYLLMITPSRWFSGGKGLDTFRKEMLLDRRFSTIVDFENSADVFPGVSIAGGVSYFLWDINHNGQCEIINKGKEEEYFSLRYLNQFDTLVRHSKSISIIDKVRNIENKFMDSIISTRKPFGIDSKTSYSSSGIPCWFKQKIGKKFVTSSDIKDEYNIINKWKVLIPFAPIAGQTDFTKPIKFYHSKNIIIAQPNEICSETYLVAASFNTEQEALNFKSYIFTKFFRFLLLQNVISQNITRNCFSFIPDLGTYNNQITDQELISKYNISQEEWSFISSKVQETA